MSASPVLPRAARKARLTLAALFLLGAASIVPAQSVTLRGAVEDDAGGFVLKCTPVHLVSAGPNLALFKGDDVELTGTVAGPNLFSVSTVAVVNDVLSVNKNASVGGELKLEVTGPVGQAVQVHFALGSGFATVKSMGWFLDTASMHFLLSGVIPAGGKLQVTLALPADPALANLELFLQVVRLVPGGGFQLGNSDCVTVQP